MKFQSGNSSGLPASGWTASSSYRVVEPGSNVLQVLLSFLISSSNSLVLAAVYCGRRGALADTRCLLLANLALADLVIGLCMGIFGLFQLASPSADRPLYCDWLYVSMVVSATASIYFLLAVTANQMVAIVHALRYHELVTERRVRWLVGAVWIVSLATGAVIVMDDHEPLHCHILLSISLPHALYLAVMIFLLPSLSLIICYSYIYFKVREHISKIAAITVVHQNPSIPQNPEPKQTAAYFLAIQTVDVTDTSVSNQAEHKKWNQEVKTTITIAVVVGIFIFSWVWFWLFGIKAQFEGDVLNLSTIWPTLGAANSLYNPIIYALRFKEFRKAFQSILC